MKKLRIAYILLACIIFFQCSTSVFATDINNQQESSKVSGNVVSDLYDKTVEAKENVDNLVNNVDSLVENAGNILDNAGNIIDKAETIIDIDQLDIDTEALIDQAQELYDNYGDEIPEEPEKAFYEYALDIIKNFFSSIIKFIMDFLSGLFS